jgi:Tol biopolymer transport system component
MRTPSSLAFLTLMRLAGAQLPFASELDRLSVHEALVVASSAVDEEPVWSPDGRYLAANVDGKWLRIALADVKLEKGEWHGGASIGVAARASSGTSLDEKTARDWKRSARFDPRSITTRNGTKLELRQVDLGTQFVVTKKGWQPETRWSTELENCHSLALSPDDRYVAFICEQNGVIVAIP